MLFMQNFGALLTVKATDYNLDVTNDRMNLLQITEQHFAKWPSRRKPNDQVEESQTTKYY